jgi:hypothetical protein
MFKFYDSNFNQTNEAIEHIKGTEKDRTLQAAVDLDNLMFLASSARFHPTNHTIFRSQSSSKA